MKHESVWTLAEKINRNSHTEKPYWIQLWKSAEIYGEWIYILLCGLFRLSSLYIIIYVFFLCGNKYALFNLIRNVPGLELLFLIGCRMVIGQSEILTFRLNMELDLESLFGHLCTNCTHWLIPSNSPLPPHLGSYTRAPLVRQDRWHLLVTPCSKQKVVRFRNVPCPFWSKQTLYF